MIDKIILKDKKCSLLQKQEIFEYSHKLISFFEHLDVYLSEEKYALLLFKYNLEIGRLIKITPKAIERILSRNEKIIFKKITGIVLRKKDYMPLINDKTNNLMKYLEFENKASLKIFLEKNLSSRAFDFVHQHYDENYIRSNISLKQEQSIKLFKLIEELKQRRNAQLKRKSVKKANENNVNNYSDVKTNEDLKNILGCKTLEETRKILQVVLINRDIKLIEKYFDKDYVRNNIPYCNQKEKKLVETLKQKLKIQRERIVLNEYFNFPVNYEVSNFIDKNLTFEQAAFVKKFYENGIRNSRKCKNAVEEKLLDTLMNELKRKAKELKKYDDENNKKKESIKYQDEVNKENQLLKKNTKGRSRQSRKDLKKYLDIKTNEEMEIFLQTSLKIREVQLIQKYYDKDYIRTKKTVENGKEKGDLGNTVSKLKREKKKMSFRNEVKDKNIEELYSIKEALGQINQRLQSIQHKNNFETKASNDISQTHQNEVTRIFSSSFFLEITKTLEPEEAMIMYLHLGFEKSKEHSIDEIASVLQIEKNDVLTIVLKSFEKYKNVLNMQVDKEIKQLEKKL